MPEPRRSIATTLVLAALGSTACGDGLVVAAVSEFEPSTGVAGVQVQVNGGDWATTDEDGEASFDGIEGPYSALVLQKNGAGTGQPHRLWQLTSRRDDRLEIPVVATGTIDPDDPTYVGQISGTLAGLSGKAGTSVVVYILTAFGSEPGEVLADGSFGLPAVVWRGEPSRAWQIVAFEHAVDADQRLRYIGAGSSTVTLNDAEGAGVRVTDAVLELGPVEERTVRGTVSVPDGIDEVSVRVDLDFGGGSSVVVHGLADVPPGDLEIDVPVIGSARARINVWAEDGDGAGSFVERTLIPPADSVAFELPRPAELVEPAPGADIDADTVFRWEAVSGVQTYSLRVLCDDIDYRMIETDDTEATLPSLPDLRHSADQRCAARVFHFEGAAFGFDAAERPTSHTRAWSAEH